MTLVSSTIDVESTPDVESAPTLLLGDLPFMVHESLVSRFTYWDVKLRFGMQYGVELYTLFQSYPIEDRLKASDVACEQTLSEIQVCITVSKATYSVWLNLRSLNAVLTGQSPKGLPL
ncbi:MAG: hypothetical protein SFY66_28655 [Oculatellaceae cyanobacterium bins.114]|nr:hypothetical protein [Oculatellaceae cyanobacterium bins.114]